MRHCSPLPTAIRSAENRRIAASESHGVRLDTNNIPIRPWFNNPNTVVNLTSPQNFGRFSTSVSGTSVSSIGPANGPSLSSPEYNGERTWTMNRRQMLSIMAASLAGLRRRAEQLYAASRPNIRWCVSSFLWTSTQWQDTGTLPYTDMLDVIHDTGFDGFRVTGWPAVLGRIGMDLAQLEKELSKRNLRIATLSFNAPADDPSRYAEAEKSARAACQFLKRFGATVLVTFSPPRVNKVLEREHIRKACQFYNHLGDVCAEYGIRTGLHNHLDQLIESQDEIELLLNWTDPKKFHWCPDTVHLYLANCDIPELFRKYADRLIFFDLVDAKYEYQTQEMRLPNGKIEKAGSQNGTFMLGNRDYGDGEVDLRGIMGILRSVNYEGWVNIDLHYARVSPQHSFERCMKYIRENLDPIYM